MYCFITDCGRQPSHWKQNSTTNLLKERIDLARVRSYRSVTIGATLSRIHRGIIYQWSAGYFNNIHILNELLTIGEKKIGLVAVLLDISKALDTIPTRQATALHEGKEHRNM
jgi:hypothetical protein